MSKVTLNDINVSYDGKTQILKGLNLEIGEGELVSLLGPSGCGKTTTLRVIAGFIIPSSGQLFVDTEEMTKVPVHKRNFGLVFQSYALFPHLSVYENVAFGLKLRKMEKAEMDRKIKEILEKGPLDLTSGKIKPGMIIRKINNQEIKKGQDYFQILEDLSGKRVMLTIYDPSTKKEWEEYVKPTTYGNQNGLLYNRWVKQRQEMVEKLSNGKIGYVHVKSMDSPSFRKVYSEILGKYRNKEAIIVDTRYNGGGWLHEDLLHLLSGKKYAEFVPRGQFIGEDPFTQWNKPSAVLVSESNYSNAHGFPWAYKELGLGKVIGMPVPGTMTAVWWETLMDPSLVFGIPQVGMKDNQGRILENMQLEPDIKVTNDPASAMKGRDLQLEAAVESLMKEIK